MNHRAGVTDCWSGHRLDHPGAGIVTCILRRFFFRKLQGSRFERLSFFKRGLHASVLAALTAEQSAFVGRFKSRRDDDSSLHIIDPESPMCRRSSRSSSCIDDMPILDESFLFRGRKRLRRQ
jgi:hypothetical protein